MGPEMMIKHIFQYLCPQNAMNDPQLLPPVCNVVIRYSQVQVPDPIRQLIEDRLVLKRKPLSD